MPIMLPSFSLHAAAPLTLVCLFLCNGMAGRRMCVNIFGDHTPCGGMFGGKHWRGMGCSKCVRFDHNTISASPQIDLDLLNFGPLNLSAGQECKSKANCSHRVPDVMAPPCCASKQHSLQLHICSLRYHSL